MKKTLFLTLFVFYISISNSQNQISENYSYEISEPYEVIDGSKSYFVHDKSMVAIKQDKKNLYIQKFDVETLKELSRKEYKTSEILPDNYYPEGNLQIEGKCLYFYSSWSGKKTKKERLYYLTINLITGDLEIDKSQIIEVDGKLAGSPLGMISFGGFGFSTGVGDKFDILKSKDTSKILVQYRRKPEVKKDTKSFDIIGINVFNKSLQPIWSKEFTMPYTERKMDVLDYAIDSDGNVSILSKIYNDDSADDRKSKKEESANYHVEVLRMTKNSSEIEITSLNLDGKFISDLAIFESTDDHVYCAGYYNNGELSRKRGLLGGKQFDSDTADGIVVFKINKQNGTLENTFYHEIPLEVLNKYVSEKEQDKNKEKEDDDAAFFAHLKLRDLIHYDDGSLVISGEQYYVVENHTQKYTYYYYNYRDILVTKINSDGSLAWMDKIPKLQVGRNGLGGMSYTHLTGNNKHYLLFLDNVKNMELQLNQFPHKHSDGKGGYLTSYAIDNTTGKVSKGSVFDSKNLEDKLKAYQFSTSRIIKISDNSFIVEVYTKGKEDVLVKVTAK